MEYRAVNNRLGVSFSRLRLPFSPQVITEILIERGFRTIAFDLVEMARQCVGTSTYRICCLMAEAPETVDCSSFMKWLYGQCGIWLPRLSIQQSERGKMVAQVDELLAGDLVFTSRYNGRPGFYRNNPDQDIGHVAIATGLGTVIHAKNEEFGVIECSPHDLLGDIRVMRRYLPSDPNDFQIFRLPEKSEIETIDDIRWLVLSQAGKTI